MRILGVLETRIASPRELSEELGAPLGNVSYHVRQLAGLGLVKLVKETPRRGAVEHYYKLETRPHLSDAAWSQAPPIVKEAMLSAVLGQVAEHVSSAAAAGGFDRADAHVSRLPMLLDEKGFKALAKELELLVPRIKKIEDASRKRLERESEDGARGAMAVLMLFEHDLAAEQEQQKPKGRRRGSSSRSRAATPR